MEDDYKLVIARENGKTSTQQFMKDKSGNWVEDERGLREAGIHPGRIMREVRVVDRIKTAQKVEQLKLKEKENGKHSSK